MNILVIGGGGHARVVADAIIESSNAGSDVHCVGFVDDDPELTNADFRGKRVCGRIEDIGKVPHDAIILAIGDNKLRHDLYQQMSARGETFARVIHPRAVIAQDVEIGLGTVVCAGVVVNCGSKIGNNVILNTGSTIDHDSSIESHAHICPGAHLGGTVSVGEGAFVGIGCSVIQNRQIGEWSVIGAGSAIIWNVPSRAKVVGVPARGIREQLPGQISREKSLQVLSIESRKEWKAALVGAHDFYHLPFYNALAQEMDEGAAKLFVYRHDGIVICLPLLTRPIVGFESAGLGSGQWYDASSVYGYAGPVSSHTSIPEAVTADFRDRLTQLLKTMRIVSVFSRLHPLFDQEPLLEGLGEIVFQGHTVSVDLSVPEQVQLAQYRENHRRSLRKLALAGATSFVDEEFHYLDRFIELYTETMHRTNATDEYMFPRSYFSQFVTAGEAEVKLIVCKHGAEIVSAGLFVKCGHIVQYHLGGTATAWTKHSPMKLVLDTARRWGHAHGARVLHLGGGVGTRDDALLRFKLGFSNRMHPFSTWRWVLFPSVYDQLVESQKAHVPGYIDPGDSTEFFPRYRSNGR